VIAGETTAGVIDEIPVLAVLGAHSQRGLEIRDAAELRVKETDRIATVAENLGRMGVEVEAGPDYLRIPGNQKVRAAELDSFGDHRIAMAFVVAALAADGPCTMRDAEAASVSFPEFYEVLDRLRS
jgi:3-phosphoshikimate 1-carboxyvinyltransferase